MQLSKTILCFYRKIKEENFNENKEPHPPGKDKKNIFFIFLIFRQEEEENFNENKEPTSEKEKKNIFSLFLTGRRKNFDETKEPPLKEVEEE